MQTREIRASIARMSSTSREPQRHPRRHRRRHHLHPAAAPGSGTYTGAQPPAEVTMTVFDFSPGELKEKTVTSAAECLAFEGDDSPAWISVTGLHETESIRSLLEAYHIHPLVQDDILSTAQGGKVEDFGDYLFITVKLLTQRAGSVEERFDLQHFSLILTGRVLLTFQASAVGRAAPATARGEFANLVRASEPLPRRAGHGLELLRVCSSRGVLERDDQSGN